MADTITAAKAGTVSKRSRIKISQRKKTILLLTMVIPGAVWLFLLRYLPMFGIVIAFKDYKFYYQNPTLWNNIIHSKWVGFDKFKFLFASTDSWKMIRNTIGYNALWIVLGMVIAVAFAIMLNEINTRFVARTYQTLMFFPYFMSWIVATSFVLAFLDPTRGLLTNIQKDLGMAPTNWYSNPKPWPVILTICNLWKNIGYSAILYYAAITGFDASQYEAASIDGATKWQQIRYITIPHLRPMITILFIMNVGKIFNADFGLFFSVPMNSGGGPIASTTMVIDTYVYRTMIVTGDQAMSSAAGLFQNAAGFVCIMLANAIVKKIDEDSSLF